MNMDRIAVVALAAACVAGLAACSGSHTLSDVQLTRLLHVERVAASDPGAPLDAPAVDCLRAWSGDVELSGVLPPAATTEDAKKACRQRIDGWIADATRNPDKVRFEDAASPPSVRRAVALLAERRQTIAPRLPSATGRPPQAMVSNTPAAAPANTGPVDLTVAVNAVNDLDGLCQKAKQANASGNTSQPIARYAGYCDKRIEQLRTRISMIQQNGNPQQAQTITQNVQRTLEVARQIEARQNGGPKPNDQ
jgi:hypothetical protein